MKTNYIIPLLIFVNVLCFSQTSDKIEKMVYVKKENAKTYNLKEKFTNTLNIALQNINVKDKSIMFKANLFGLNTKLDSTAFYDYNLKKKYFERNFQINAGVNFNENTLSGVKAGFTYNIINKRDSLFFNYQGSKTDKKNQEIQDRFISILNNYLNKCEDEASKNPKLDKYKCFQNGESLNIALNSYDPSQIGKDEIKGLNVISVEEYKNIIQDIDSLISLEVENYFKKPLLTFSVNGTFGENDKFLNSGEASLVYLRGLKAKTFKYELELKSAFSVSDTLAPNSKNKMDFKSSAGLNFVLLSNKKGESFFELKPYFEYIKNINPLADEKTDNFNANMDLRLRILKNLWLPLNIKYDVKKGDFLGFIDFVFDFGLLAGKK